MHSPLNITACTTIQSTRACLDCLHIIEPAGGERSLDRVGHGDLLVHELRIHPSGDIIQEMEFSRGSMLLIRCSDLTHREELLS